MEYGNPYEEFWRRTPAELDLILTAQARRFRTRQREQMAQAYAIGVLVHQAFNNPRKFPKADDFLKEKTRRVASSLEEQRAFLSKFAKKVK